MCDPCGCNITPGNEHLITGGGWLAGTDEGREAIILVAFADMRDRAGAEAA